MENDLQSGQHRNETGWTDQLGHTNLRCFTDKDGHFLPAVLSLSAVEAPFCPIVHGPLLFPPGGSYAAPCVARSYYGGGYYGRGGAYYAGSSTPAEAITMVDAPRLALTLVSGSAFHSAGTTIWVLVVVTMTDTQVIRACTLVTDPI